MSVDNIIKYASGNFSYDQVKMYAASFEKGDAILVQSGDILDFQEVIPDVIPTNNLISSGEDNPYVIRRGDKGIEVGFRDSNYSPYIILTPSQYKLKGGEKIVRLGDSRKGVYFGKTYNVYISEESGNPVFRGDDGIAYLIKGDVWGIIPRYSQVSGESEATANESLNLSATFKIANMDELQHMLDDLQRHLDEADRLYNAISEWKPDINIVKSDVLKRTTGGDNNDH